MLTDETVPTDGPMTTARPGDVMLRNDRIAVVIQGEGRHLATNPWGGNLIDADLVRQDGSFHDVFGELGNLTNLAGTSSAESVVALPQLRCTPARARAEGDYVLSDYINLKTGISEILPGLLDDIDVDAPYPLHFTTDYTLEPDSSAVRIATAIRNDGSETVPVTLSWLIDAGMVNGSVPDVDSYALDTLGTAEYFVFEGPDVAYGILPLTPDRFLERGYVSIVGGYALTHELSFTNFLGFPDTVAQVAPGDHLIFEALFVVGADHASVTELLRETLGEPACTVVSGAVTEEGSGTPIPGARVTAIDASDGSDGADLAHTSTDDQGSYRMCLPPGEVRLITGTEGRPYAGGGTTPQRIDVSVSGASVEVELTLPPTGTLSATVTDGGGSPLPSRLAIMGIDPSPWSPRLEGQGFDPKAPGLVAAIDSVDGSFALSLEPGEYQAVFTHGPEFSMASLPLTITAGEPAQLSATLHRVVDSTGYVTGDFHVHAQASPDSTRTNRTRVANMIAEGVEVLVSTDHDYVTDFGPTVEQMGVGGQIATFAGEEITSFDYGHFNAFPLDVDPTSPNNGAVDWAGLTPTEIGQRVLSGPRPVVFQLNHPRQVPAPGVGGNYFQVIDLQFDATGPYTGPEGVAPEIVRLPAGSSLLATNFTAMEVITWLDVQGLHDWYNFINAGHFFTATGNSDTHTQFVESSGWPRNYVAVGVDDPTQVTAEALATNLNAGRNTVSFGPFATLQAVGATTGTIGDTVAPDGSGDVQISVRVQAPTWIPFDDVVLWDGAAGIPLAGGAATPETVSAGSAPEAVRLEWTTDHTWQPTSDTWVVAVVQGTGSMFPAFPYNTAEPEAVTLEAIRDGTLEGGATAFALTNPIWIDADGDGVITPNHLVLPPDWGDWRWEDRTNPY